MITKDPTGDASKKNSSFLGRMGGNLEMGWGVRAALHIILFTLRSENVLSTRC